MEYKVVCDKCGLVLEIEATSLKEAEKKSTKMDCCGKIKHYIFKVEMAGMGKTPEEAWEDCLEGFMQDPGIPPENYTVEEEE